MMSSRESPQTAASPPENSWRPSLLARLFAFAPLWFLLYATFAWQASVSHPMTTGPDALGIPPGVLVNGLAMVWMLIGAYVLWGTRSFLVEVLAIFVFAVPALATVIFGPAVVLILQNPT